MTDVIDSNEAERHDLNPVIGSCIAGYLAIMLMGYIVGGLIF